MATIPAMPRAPMVALRALASRSLDKAQQAAASAQVPRAYGRYEDLIADRGAPASADGLRTRPSAGSASDHRRDWSHMAPS